MTKSIGRPPKRSGAKGKAVARSAHSATRKPAPKRGVNAAISISEDDYPFIGGIVTEEDLIRQINEFRESGRKSGEENAYNVAAAFQRGLDLGLVRWGTHQSFVKTHLHYEASEVTKFRRLLRDRPIASDADKFYEENKGSLDFPLRKKKGIDLRDQKNRAYLKYRKAIEGSATKPPLDHEEALRAVSKQMTPTPTSRGPGKVTTTVKQREQIRSLLEAYSTTHPTVYNNWASPNKLTQWLCSVHPAVRNALLEEAEALADTHGRKDFAEIAYPSRMKRLWAWREGIEPDTGDDDNFTSDGKDAEGNASDPAAAHLGATPEYPYDMAHVGKPTDVKAAWDFLRTKHALDARQIDTWAGLSEAAESLRGKIHPNHGGNVDDAQSVAAALEVLTANHPQKPAASAA